MLFKPSWFSFVYLLFCMHLHRDRRVHQQPTMFKQHQPYQHQANNTNVEQNARTRLIMNGGILTQRSDDNLGEEDEIECLADDDSTSDGHAFENEDNDRTLSRDTYNNTQNMTSYQQRCLGERQNIRDSYAEYLYQNHNASSDKQGTLLFRNENSTEDNNNSTLQNNNDSNGAGSNKKFKTSDISQVPRVQRILEKGKANLSRSKSELGEQHRKVLSQLSKGKSEITEQNRRILANITSGMDKGKRFMLPGFGFTNSSSSSSKSKEAGCEENRSFPAEEITTGQRMFNQNNPELMNGREHTPKDLKMPDDYVADNSRRSFTSVKKAALQNGDSVNKDLDQMLTNLGIQISAAEAATTVTASYSDSGAAPSLMTQSVFVAPTHQSSSMLANSNNDNTLTTDTSITTNCDRRLVIRSNLASSRNSDTSILRQRYSNFSDGKNMFHPTSTSLSLGLAGSVSGRNTDYGEDERAENFNGDGPDYMPQHCTIEDENKAMNPGDINDYLQLERTLENDYGEFDFIDGEATLSRTAASPYVNRGPNIKYVASKSAQCSEESRGSEEQTQNSISLFDDVLKEIDKVQQGTSDVIPKIGTHKSTIEAQASKQGNHLNSSGSSTKRNRRLSSSSLSAVCVSETNPVCNELNIKGYSHPESNASLYVPASTPNSAVFTVSSASSTPKVSVYADHTLMLRSHHRRRRWLLMNHSSQPQELNEVNKGSVQQNPLHVLEHLQQQKQYPNLRRCTSLAQNVYSESSSDYSPYLMSNGHDAGDNLVNGIGEFQNKDQVSQKLFLLNENCSPSQRINGTNIDNDNNSAKNKINNISWLSTPISSSVKKRGSSSDMPSEQQNFPNTRLQYCNTDVDSDKAISNNTSILDKVCGRQRNRRSPWLLRSNLSSYARRRRGSSTSLHTIGLNDEEPLNEVDHSSRNNSTIITSTNGAKQSSLTPNCVALQDKRSIHNQDDKQIADKLIGEDVPSSFRRLSSSTGSASDAMSLNRRYESELFH